MTSLITLQAELSQLIQQARQGALMSRGARVVITGAPNAERAAYSISWLKTISRLSPTFRALRAMSFGSPYRSEVWRSSFPIQRVFVMPPTPLSRKALRGRKWR
ncbi:MAG: hypothetical protein CM15mP74_13390 [Halieaceae bacterium]|nr:MAG: hypothetical protein CM15mP74_13390 [Halieaceae bacterium]